MGFSLKFDRLFNKIYRYFLKIVIYTRDYVKSCEVRRVIILLLRPLRVKGMFQ